MKIHHICFQPKVFCHYVDDFDHICIQPKIFCHHRYVDDFMIAKMLWLIPAMFEMSSVVGYSCLIYVIFVGTSGRPGCVGECQVLGILPSRQQVTARPGVCLQKKVRPSRSKVTTLTNVLTGKLKV